MVLACLQLLWCSYDSLSIVRVASLYPPFSCLQPGKNLCVLDVGCTPGTLDITTREIFNSPRVQPYWSICYAFLSDRPVLLDGGLGTTLEDNFQKDIAHPLWSAKLVDKEEDVIVAAHLAFLQAGSQVILASTYQAAYETFSRAQHSKSEAERLMLKSVELAVRAREKYEQTHSQTTGSVTRAKIALALGPYGATLEPAAEYTGIYPPPYGPSPVSPTLIIHPEYGLFSQSDEISHTNALAAFHFSRLLVYARHTDVWNAIDLLAFETIPLVTEAKAIRMAVAKLENWLREAEPRDGKETMTSSRMKPWYLSFVFPGPRGEFIQSRSSTTRPQEREELDSLDSSDGHIKIPTTYTAYEVAQAALVPETDGDQRAMSVPDGIGVNCTPCHVIASIVNGFTSAIRDKRLKAMKHNEELPWLVLYPNGGQMYDPVEKTWSDDPLVSSGQVKERQKTWAKALAELIYDGIPEHSVLDRTVFGGLLIGGCCKTGPNEVKELKSQLSIP